MVITFFTKYKKWIGIGFLSGIFAPFSGLTSGILLIHFANWLDITILDNECSYEICPLKYDIVFVLSLALIPLVSFLTGYLMYHLIEKISNLLERKEKKIATS